MAIHGRQQVRKTANWGVGKGAQGLSAQAAYREWHVLSLIALTRALYQTRRPVIVLALLCPLPSLFSVTAYLARVTHVLYRVASPAVTLCTSSHSKPGELFLLLYCLYMEYKCCLGYIPQWNADVSIISFVGEADLCQTRMCSYG